MPRLTRKLPTYRLHKASGQALVCLDGRRIYLGPYDSPESRAEFDRLTAEWLAGGRRLPVRSGGRGGLTVNEVILAHWRWAEGHYTRDGKPTRHLENLKAALGPVRRLYGHIAAADFGAAALETVRRAMIDSGLCRNTVNGRVGKVRSMFRWAVNQKLVPADVLTELGAVRGLQFGRDGVRETDPVRPAPEEHVAAALPFMPAPVRAMVQLQALSGMRPGEVVAMRSGEVDRSGEIWVFRPRRHKTLHKGVNRAVALGPQAQAVLGPWLKDDPATFVFPPAAAVAARDARKRECRRSPVRPGRKAARPKRAPGECYSRCAYREAVARACSKAGVPVWSPNKLRHAAGTRVASQYGLAAAQAVLGHKSIRTTEVYVRPDPDKAAEVMGRIG
jgi:integrase